MWQIDFFKLILDIFISVDEHLVVRSDQQKRTRQIGQIRLAVQLQGGMLKSLHNLEKMFEKVFLLDESIWPILLAWIRQQQQLYYLYKNTKVEIVCPANSWKASRGQARQIQLYINNTIIY